MKIYLDDRLINEAIRIRKNYLISINQLNNNQNSIEDIKNELESAYIYITENQSTINESDFDDKLKELTLKVKKFENDINTILKNIEKLKNDSNILFENIKEIYPDITEKELIIFLEPHLSKIEKEYNIFN